MNTIIIFSGIEQIAYHNLNATQYTRTVRDLLLLLRYRVELYEESGSCGYKLKAKGILGNLVDFEDIVSECVELAELSTISCAHLIDDDLTSEVSTFTNLPNMYVYHNCNIFLEQAGYCILQFARHADHINRIQ